MFLQVHDRFNVPVIAVFIVFVFVSLISLIDLGSYVAFNAIISLQLISLFATYEVAIGTLIYRRLYGPPLPDRRWSLGRWGLGINIFAFVYGLFALSFIVLPGSPGFSAASFNWAPVIFVGVMVLAFAYFFLGGRKTYAGQYGLGYHAYLTQALTVFNTIRSSDNRQERRRLEKMKGNLQCEVIRYSLGDRRRINPIQYIVCLKSPIPLE